MSHIIASIINLFSDIEDMGMIWYDTFTFSNTMDKDTSPMSSAKAACQGKWMRKR